MTGYGENIRDIQRLNHAINSKVELVYFFLMSEK